jgi:hypothetical protein
MSNGVANAFEHTKVPYGDDGKLVRGIIARCGAPNCEAAIPLPVNVMGASRGVDDHIEHQFIARKLEQKGWRIGKSRTSHRCPKCFNAAKMSATNKSEEKIVANKKEMLTSTSSSALQVVQENSRVMTREDRRIVFEKLNEVYVSDKVGYDKGWTDEKVATDLGVPRAWVRLIREENFGDEVGNEEIRQLLQEGQTYLDKIKQAQEGWKARTQEVEDWLRKATGIGERIARQLAEIQKVLK